MSGLKSWVGNRNGIPAPVQSTTNGASHTTSPDANNRRQLVAAQARMPPPPTRLARQPLQAPIDRPENRNYNSVAPNHVKVDDRSAAVAETFDSQDHFGGAFDTDVEAMDETSILSETQVKDSQVDGRDTAHATNPWDTRPPGEDWNHAINQAWNNQQDAPMGNYADYNAEGTEDGEASGLEEEGDISGDEVWDDASVASMNLARELQAMKADTSWRPLVERPKNRANIVSQQRQSIPEPVFQHYPESNKQARGRAQNLVSSTPNLYSDIASGESDPDEEHSETTRKKGPHLPRKEPASQPKVLRVHQVKQSQQTGSPPAQQPREVVHDRSVKLEQPPTHQPATLTGSQTPHADETDHPEEIKPDLSDIAETDRKQNAAPPPTTTLLPEHPPPHPPKRRLSLDYDPATLRTMPYTDLQSQPFDHNPHPLPSPLSEPLLSDSLPSKLQHITTLADGHRNTFFSTLTLAEWEDSGDWFVERFGELVKKMSAARTERRRVAGEFEAEVARREEFVRGRREGVEGEMRKMRRGGEDVLRSKGP